MNRLRKFVPELEFNFFTFFLCQCQGQEFEKEICPCSKILYFEVSDATMTERLLNRGKTSGRVDDNEETIKKRLNTFHQHSKPVIEAYNTKAAIVSIFRLILIENDRYTPDTNTLFMKP